MRNPDNIRREEDRVRLDELPAANRKLAKLYIHQQDLKALWDYRHVGYAWRFWLDWQARAIRSRIEPLKAFARRLKAKIDGVPAHCRRPLRTSLLEGINNKIKVIKRMACQSAAKVAWVRRIVPDTAETQPRAAVPHFRGGLLGRGIEHGFQQRPRRLIVFVRLRRIHGDASDYEVSAL